MDTCIFSYIFRKADCPRKCVCQPLLKSRLLAIDCSHVKMRNVPNIPYIAKTLKLNNNLIASIRTDQFSNLSELTDLDLSNNKIRKLERNAFRGLSKLKVLYLTSNYLDTPGSVTEDTFKPLIRLSHLRLIHNCISKTRCWPLLNAITYAKSIEVLHLDGYQGITFPPSFKHFKNLTYISFGGVDGQCNLNPITNQTFTGLAETAINTIDIGHCWIQHVQPGSFSSLKGLRHLNVSANDPLCHDGWRNLTTGLHFTSIQTLDLSNTCVGRQGDNHTLITVELAPLHKTRLLSLKLNHCYLQVIEPRVITDALPSTLKRLELQENNINQGYYVIFLPFLVNLQYLDVSSQNRNDLLNEPFNTKMTNDFDYGNENNSSTEYTSKHGIGNMSLKRTSKHGFDNISLKETSKHEFGNISLTEMSKHGIGNINETDTSMREFENFSLTGRLMYGREPMNLMKLFLQQIQTSRIVDVNTRWDPTCAHKLPVLSLPQQLKFLNVSNLNLDYPSPKVIFNSNNSLEVVDVSKGLVWYVCGKISGLHRLKYVNASVNKIKYINYDAFEDMPRLEDLNLSENQFGDMFNDIASEGIFRNLIHLIKLDLTRTKIKILPKLIFSNLQSLQELKLRDNALQVIHFSVKGFMNSIRFLDLSHNNILFLPSEMTSILERAPSRLLLLINHNKLRCDCDHVPFAKWIGKTKINIPQFRNITCKVQNGTSLRLPNLKLIQAQIALSCVTWLVPVCVSVFIGLIIVLSLVVALYRQRWKLQYLYYASLKRTNPYVQLDDQCGETNDVYLSFDQEHVLENGSLLYDIISIKVIKALEERGLGVKFREHLCAGKSLYFLISSAVQQSNKTVVFLSRDYCKDPFNIVEFRMAACDDVYTNRKVIVPVLIEDIDSNNLKPDMIAYLKNEAVIKFSEETFEEFIEKLCHMISK